jgi:hypothetical protein
MFSGSLVGAGLFPKPDTCAQLHGASKSNIARADESRRMNFIDSGPDGKCIPSMLSLLGKVRNAALGTAGASQCDAGIGCFGYGLRRDPLRL